MIDTSTEWDIVSQMPGESWFAARLYYGPGTKYLSVGSKDFVLDDEKFLGIISNKPSIKGGFDIQTRSFEINRGMIEVIDSIDWVTTFGELASTLGSGNDIGFENRQVDLRLIKDGISKFSNGFPLLERGRMYKPEYDAGLVTINVEDDTKNKFGKIGELVTEDDARSGYTLPPASAGLIRPIIYGDHRYNIGTGFEGDDLTKEDWDPNIQPRFVPMVDLNGNYWMVEDHEIAGTPAQAAGQHIWTKNPIGGGWIRARDWAVIQNSGTGVILELEETGSGTGLYDWEAFTMPLLVSNQGTSNFSNIENAKDQDVTTAATISISGINNNGILRFVFVNAEYPSGQLREVRLMLTGNGDWGAANQLFVDGQINDYYTPADLTDTFHEHFNSIAEGSINSIDLTFRVASAGTKNASILDVYRAIAFFTVGFNGQLFWGGLGHALEEWIDDADRAGHFDFGNSGDPAENPASCIESLSRNDMGLGDDDIDMDSFDEVSNVLSAAKANFDIRKVTDFKTWLSKMARQFVSVITFGINSKLKMQAILSEYTSADVVISYNDMAKLKFGRTDDDQLTSKLSIEYSYDGSRFLNKTAEIENATTRTRYNLDEVATSRNIKAEMINDQTTADLYGDYELAFWQQHHNTIDEMHLDMSFMKYDLVDILRIIDLPEKYFPNGENVTEEFTRAGQAILPYFMINGFERSDRIILRGIQMADTS